MAVTATISPAGTMTMVGRLGARTDAVVVVASTRLTGGAF